MILLIDNYDSFTYNLYQYLSVLGEKVYVVRNDKITIEEIQKMKPESIVLSPGPCTPNESGICKDIVLNLKNEIPILGICLGHQTIAKMFGAMIVKAIKPVHGKTSEIIHNNRGVFAGLKNPLRVTRYHSLVVEMESLPKDFEITSMTKEGEIMGIMHKNLPIEGVQFHPEAILTEQGLELLDNFLNKSRRWWGNDN